MHSSFSSVIRRALPFAFAALVFVTVQHAPALADSTTQQVCGSIDLNSSSSADAAKAFDCFNAAFAKCAPATLVATGQDTAGAASWAFQTVDGGDDHGCSVSETIEHGSAGTKTTDACLCRTVNRDKDSLRFSGCTNHNNVALRLGSTVGATSAPQSQPVVKQPDQSKN